MDYKDKYLKYKSKYLNIKKQIGGNSIIQYIRNLFTSKSQYKYPTAEEYMIERKDHIVWRWTNIAYSLNSMYYNFTKSVNNGNIIRFYDLESIIYIEDYKEKEDIKLAEKIITIKNKADKKLKNFEKSEESEKNDILKKQIMNNAYNSIIPDYITLETRKLNNKIIKTLLKYNTDTMDKESIADNKEKKASTDIINNITNKNDLINNEKKLLTAIAYSVGLAQLAEGMNDDKVSDECFLAIKMILYEAATANITKYIRSSINVLLEEED